MENRKGYKAFKKGLVCKNKQYAENTTFEENKAVICKSGMHYCVNPFDVLDYYPLVDENGDFSDFAEVEALEEPVTDDDRKFATSKLHIGAKLSFKEFITAAINFLREETVKDMPKDNVSSGGSAQIGSSGYSAQIGSSGDYAQIGSSGGYAKIGSSGDFAQIGSSGHYAQIGSSGDAAQIGSSGDYAKIGSSGYSAKINSEGEDSVICCAGHGSKVRAKKGSWITLSEWEYSKEKGRYTPKCVKTEYVDGKHIKEDVFYMLKDGEFTEV